MITDPNNSSHWLLLARDRLEKADALFTRFGSSWSGVELLHEAAERYLKGYLVHKSWQLVKTHDLGLLIAQASQFDSQFVNFAETSRILTEQFWEQHYPGGDLDEVGQDYTELRQALGELVALIETTLAPAAPPP
ncbi:MAG: HEPN domain-containing protein [Verrucomicrobia bacterium]|nr:HEPN domain-containing protein [Verrucomicrobiota bacterium]